MKRVGEILPVFIEVAIAANDPLSTVLLTSKSAQVTRTKDLETPTRPCFITSFLSFPM